MEGKKGLRVVAFQQRLIGKVKLFPHFICMEDQGILRCLKLLDSDNKVKLLRHYKLHVFCASHKFRHGVECHKGKALNFEIYHGQHVTILHPCMMNAVRYLVDQ